MRHDDVKIEYNLRQCRHMEKKDGGSNGADPAGDGMAWQLSGYISEMMQAARVPAMSISVLRGNELVYSRGFGHRDMQALLPADGSTLYGIGSVTKSFASIAVLQLHERGLVDIHAKIGTYLPEFGGKSPLADAEVHHLMSHSSGIPTLNVAEISLARQFGDDTSFIPMASYEDFVHIVNASSSERVAAPGRRFLYWNEGYTILGRLVEKVTGESFESYVRKNLLIPLGMPRSGFGEVCTAGDPDAATFYDRKRDGRLVAKQLRTQLFDAAAGGIISSMTELCNYMRMLMGGGAIAGNRVISSDLLEESFTGDVDSGQPTQFGNSRYGYGWIIADNFFGHRIVYHSGDVGISSAFVAFVPDLLTGVAVASNTGGGPNSLVGLYALALAAGRRPDELDFVRAQRLSSRLAGEYSDYMGYTSLTVSEWGAGFMKAEFRSDEVEYSMPFIVEGGEVYTMAGYNRMKVYCRELSDGRMEIVFDRHRFLKR